MIKPLYNVPSGTKIRLMEHLRTPPAHRDLKTGEILTFNKIDGMYSLCFDSEGNPVHLAAWSEVEVINDN